MCTKNTSNEKSTEIDNNNIQQDNKEQKNELKQELPPLQMIINVYIDI